MMSRPFNPNSPHGHGVKLVRRGQSGALDPYQWGGHRRVGRHPDGIRSIGLVPQANKADPEFRERVALTTEDLVDWRNLDAILAREQAERYCSSQRYVPSTGEFGDFISWSTDTAIVGRVPTRHDSSNKWE